MIWLKPNICVENQCSGMAYTKQYTFFEQISWILSASSPGICVMKNPSSGAPKHSVVGGSVKEVDLNKSGIKSLMRN